MSAWTATRLPGFAATAIIVFILLYLPIVTLVAYSFNASPSVSSWGGFSLSWYGKAWENEAVQDATVRSLVLATSAALIATVVATMAALGTTRRAQFRGQTFIYVVINQPLMVPEIVTAVALLIVFASVKVATGYQGMGYLILAHAAFCIPFAYLPIRARLEGMDLSLETAAADLYVGRTGHPADLHAGPASARHHARGQCHFHRTPWLDRPFADSVLPAHPRKALKTPPPQPGDIHETLSDCHRDPDADHPGLCRRRAAALQLGQLHQP